MDARKTLELCVYMGMRWMLAGLLICGMLPAQEKTVDTVATLHAEARLVTIPVAVRDKKGVLVTTLGKGDFSLTVDGQGRPIRYFDKDNDLPLTLGLLVDTSMSQRAVLNEERDASTVFLETMLGTHGGEVKDKAFVIQFAHEADLLQDVTDGKARLQAALKQIDGDAGRAERDDGGQGGDGGHRHGGGGGGTVLYDAVYLSGNELMTKQKGRKALIVLSDGDDRGSKETLAKAIEAAQRADTVVYAIYFKGEHGGGGYGGYGGGHGGRGDHGGGGRDEVDGKKVLERMCEETGGRLFEVKGKETVGKIYGEIGEELRSQYRLGFTPAAGDAEDGYHRLVVTVADGKDRVQARDGYYLGK